MSTDLKMVTGIVGVSLVILVAAIFGLGNLGQTSDKVVQIQGEERLVAGDEAAKVKVVEFSDFQCPACRAAHGLVGDLIKMEGVKVIYRYLPLASIHKNAQKSAEAAEAANAQGKFWEFGNMLFEQQDEWAELDGEAAIEKWGEYAGSLGMDGEKLKNEVKDGIYKGLVSSDYQEALRLRIQATPTFFVNGRQVATSDLLKTVQEELQK